MRLLSFCKNTYGVAIFYLDLLASFDGIVKSQFTVSTNLDLTTEYNPLEERPLFLKSAQDLGIEFGAVCREKKRTI
ncbi:Uncharacterized protein APZ42_024288 [Daphnia magna]|uniref:Uncharacterized protein n=1 Tax=Daphnia magna TaxID=35525 RepID=A0A164UL06_9CRUS|nr:Uncharacterized protein APZ42_024288 [Daphnia magna]